MTSAGQSAASPAATRVRLLADAHPAAALDDDEPRRVRVGVRLDAGVAGEGQLGDDAAGVGVDDLAGQADRDPGGPSGRRWPTPNRRISMRHRAPPAPLPPAALRRRGARRRAA